MKISSLLKYGAVASLLSSTCVQASGVVPETSVVIVEQADGEGAINIKNTDSFPVLLLTTLENITDDSENLITVTPPAARVEPGKKQRVRFLVTTTAPLKTERLKRVIFEGVPPQQKDKNEVHMTVRQNLPVIIRPAGLEKDLSPWKHLTWKHNGNTMTVTNPSPYVVRLSQDVQTLPDNTRWTLPNTYVLPGQTLTLNAMSKKMIAETKVVRISPASTWGYDVGTFDAPLSN